MGWEVAGTGGRIQRGFEGPIEGLWEVNILESGRTRAPARRSTLGPPRGGQEFWSRKGFRWAYAHFTDPIQWRRVANMESASDRWLSPQELAECLGEPPKTTARGRRRRAHDRVAQRLADTCATGSATLSSGTTQECLRRRASPVTSWGHVPLVPRGLKQGHHNDPNHLRPSGGGKNPWICRSPTSGRSCGTGHPQA